MELKDRLIGSRVVPNDLTKICCNAITNKHEYILMSITLMNADGGFCCQLLSSL